MSDDNTELFDWGNAGRPITKAEAKQLEREEGYSRWRIAAQAKKDKAKDKAHALTKALHDNADDTKTHIFIAVIEPNIATEIKQLIGEKPSTHDYVRLTRYIKKVMGKPVIERYKLDKLSAIRLTKSQAVRMRLSYGEKFHIAEDEDSKLWKQIGEIEARLIADRGFEFLHEAQKAIAVVVKDISGVEPYTR